MGSIPIVSTTVENLSSCRFGRDVVERNDRCFCSRAIAVAVCLVEHSGRRVVEDLRPAPAACHGPTAESLLCGATHSVTSPEDQLHGRCAQVLGGGDIADAAPGSPIHQQIVTWAQRVRDLDVPVWFSFNHEPEFVGNTPNGTDQDFIDAWRRVHAEFVANGVTNAEFVWIMTDYSFDVPSTDRRHAPKWYPGDDVVSHIAADAYNWSDCRDGVFNPWRSLEEIIDPLRQFGASHPDKGVLLAEWASTESGGDKAAWIDDASELFMQPGWDQFIAVSHFNDIDPASPNCSWPIDSSPSSLEAIRDMGSLAFYGGGGAPPDEDPVVSVLAPVGGAVVSGLVSLVADASDDVGVVSVEFGVDGVSVGVDADGSDGWSVEWESTSVVDGGVSVSAIATDTGGNTAADSVDVTVDNVVDPPGGSVLLVVGAPASLVDGDAAVVARLEGLGHSVSVVDDNGVTAGAASGFDVVVVSSTVSSSTVGATFRDVAVPVWVAKPWILDDMEMTGPTGNVDFGLESVASLTVVDGTHPTAAGRLGGVPFTSGSRTLSWGDPVASASVVATVAGGAAIFAYDRGDVLDDGSAAAGCRVSFPLYQSAPTVFTDDAWAMFDATATWTLNECL